MPTLLLGSIGVLAETSELQRQAFNRAFEEVGLDWDWSRTFYADLLKQSGGRDRIEREAERLGETVDADAVHALKSGLFQAKLSEGVELRPGVADTICAARDNGWSLGFVTTTSARNVDAILAASGLDRIDFDIVTDSSVDVRPKPSPDAYNHAVRALGADPAEVWAVEDNPDGLQAAQKAGVRTIAFPGLYHEDHQFDGADRIMERLTLPRIDEPLLKETA